VAKGRRPLRFALSGALLVPGLLGAACGPDDDDATMNIALPPEGEEVPAERTPRPRPTGNVAVMNEAPPIETANPVGEEPPTEEIEVEDEEGVEPPPSPMRTNVR